MTSKQDILHFFEKTFPKDIGAVKHKVVETVPVDRYVLRSKSLIERLVSSDMCYADTSSRNLNKSFTVHEAKNRLLKNTIHRELIRVTSSGLSEDDVMYAIQSHQNDEKENRPLSRYLSKNSSRRQKSFKCEPDIPESYSEETPFATSTQTSTPASTPPPPPPPTSKAPPPPPVPKKAGGTPPPPPPKGGSKGKLPQKGGAGVKVRKMKMLHWDKIRKPGSGSIWREFQTQRSIRLEALESQFKIQDIVKTFDTSAKKVDKTVRLIDQKRSHNLSIQLSGIRRPYCEVGEALINMDSSVLTMDELLILKTAVPSKKECSEISDYINGIHPDYKGICDIKLLGPVEKYFLEVKDIHRLQQRIECFIFVRSFSEVQDEVQKQLDVVNEAIEQVYRCDDLGIFLHTVLSIGNFLNCGTNKGGANGYRLESLLILHNIKSLDKKSTLLSFCIEEGFRRSKTMGTLAMQLSKVPQASNIQIGIVEDLLGEVHEGFERVKMELREVESYVQKAGVQEPSYASILKNFLSTNYHEYNTLKTYCSKILEKLQNLSQYFDAVHDPREHMKILQILKTFLEIYEVNVRQLLKSDDKKEKGIKHSKSDQDRSVKRKRAKKLERCTSVQA